jgi:hypothetical protein
MRTAIVTFAVAHLAACSSASPPPDDGRADGGASLPGNAISGSVMGMAFTTVASSYWIGHPSAGGAPTQVYLSDERVGCATLAAPGWDKTLAASSQLLEMGLAGSTAITFHVPAEADANYLVGNFNPSADGGTITIAALNSGKNIVGSFDIAFGTTTLTGTFDAPFCEAGVEP